jgi:multiple sugar transport system ATP-binding protein
MAGVVLERVSRVYPGGVAAVSNFDLEVKDKELVVLVGPSGCGKTTTLRLVAGLEELTAGRILIGDREVSGLAPKDRDIAMVFQNYALYPHMSVYKNMAFGLEMRYGSGWLRRAICRVVWPSRARKLVERRSMIDSRVREAARVLGIDGLLGRMPRDLSGGERQRVALGRAIVREPAAFLFDEPLSNLDARLREETRREIKQLHRRLEATILYVTHDQVEALTLGDRVVVMDRGVVQQIGAPLEVYDNPANRFVAAFIGTPPMNLLAGRLVADSDSVVFRGGSWSARLDRRIRQLVQRYVGQPVLLGIRAEHVHLTRADTGLEGPAPAEVRLVEPLGDSTIVHLDLPGVPGADGREGEPRAARVLCRAEARTQATPGSQVSIYFDMRRAQVFDARTGANVGRAANVEGN